ncbi:glycoside hydrolase family 16 protein [Psychroflexus salis]|uniref:Glycosyl hydrolase family 16 n=1 Tax=Psychroflexus salis TaxID=1526574 RepID=A0A917E5Y6_9FLAO|nr:glycoside hydrolase family 16 protein [Psychroflexus salis]GGE03916.1 glycosyl hydrolase family 16 [Psychroflexus salis]
MKKIITLSKKILCVCILAFSFNSCDTDETQTITTFENLVFEDEFEGNALDMNVWDYEIGTGVDGWGNQELQYYTDRPENIKVEDGKLIITAKQESFEGSGYSSARILTKDKYNKQYGRIEARMKMPWGRGLWPAFWMLGENIDEVSWPQTGEIDIMEYRGQDPTIVHGSVHGPGYSAGNAVTKTYDLKNDRFDTDFHVFGIEWGENYINYYVDDFLYNRITPEDVSGEWVFNKPFFMLINMAVGGTFVGSPSPQTVFPQTLEVDYVRIYEK